MTVIPFEPRKKKTTSPAESSLRETYLTLENQAVGDRRLSCLTTYSRSWMVDTVAA